MALLIKLLLAHLIGDFILQPEGWVKEKEVKKLRSHKLYIHALLHGVLVYFAAWNNNPLCLAIIVAVLHLMIDACKLVFQKDNNKRAWFFIDQSLHILVLAGLAYCVQGPIVSIESLFSEKHLIYLLAIIALTTPTSFIIKNVISKWEPSQNNDSLENAGMYIGIIERLLVLSFVVTGHWEPMGYLIAAKSIFRFGDLKESKDRKLTEYILIGTLLSFGMALAVAMMVRYLLKL